MSAWGQESPTFGTREENWVADKQITIKRLSKRQDPEVGRGWILCKLVTVYLVTFLHGVWLHGWRQLIWGFSFNRITTLLFLKQLSILKVKYFPLS